MATTVFSEKEYPAANIAYSAQSDDALVALFQAGDLLAIEKLLTRHRGIVWRGVKQYLGSLNEAEDIFQDILLTLLQNPQSFQLKGVKFSSWLFRVVTNRCLDILRSKSSSLKQGELDETIPTDMPDAEDNLSRHQISEQLISLLEELPRQQKMALSLYYYEDMDMTAISKTLSVSEGAARALIKRGRENLRGMNTCPSLM